MSTLTQEISKAPIAARKREDFTITVILKDKKNQILAEPHEKVLVKISFDILEQDTKHIVALFRGFEPAYPKQVNIRIHMASREFAKTDYRELIDLLGIDGNLEAFLKALEIPDYRLSNDGEFRAWHELHCANFKRDHTEPWQTSVNGGLSETIEGERAYPMLEAGYGGNDPFLPPAPTYLKDELALIFGGDDAHNKTAILLTRI